MTYLHAVPREQAALMALVQGIEAAVEAAGVPVHTPRKQAFHLYVSCPRVGALCGGDGGAAARTLGRVLLGYPVDKVVAALNGTDWGHFRFSWFVLNEALFSYALDD